MHSVTNGKTDRQRTQHSGDVTVVEVCVCVVGRCRFGLLTSVTSDYESMHQKLKSSHVLKVTLGVGVHVTPTFPLLAGCHRR